MNIKNIIAIIFIGTLFISSGCGGGGGGGSVTGPSDVTVTPTVYMYPATKTVNNGNTVTIDVYVSSVSNLFYAAFDVVYDSTKVTYSSGTAGSFLAPSSFSAGPPSTLSGNFVTMPVGVTRLNGTNGGVSGNGVLCSLTFNTTQSGTTSIYFNSNPSTQGFMNVNSQPISITVGNGTKITIQ